MKIFILLLSLTLLSACSEPPITKLDKKLLLTADDLINIGCKATKASDLTYESSGLPYLLKEISAEYNGSEKCHFYINAEVSTLKISFIGGNDVQTSLNGAMLGFKMADITTKEPETKHKGLAGKYLETYKEDDNSYMGFVYASKKDSVSIMVMVFGINKEHQPALLDLVKDIEFRNFKS